MIVLPFPPLFSSQQQRCTNILFPGKKMQKCFSFPCYLFFRFTGVGNKICIPSQFSPFFLSFPVYTKAVQQYFYYFSFLLLCVCGIGEGGGGQRCFVVVASRFIFPNVHASSVSPSSFLLLSTPPTPPMLNVFFLRGGGGNTFASFQHFPQQKMQNKTLMTHHIFPAMHRYILEKLFSPFFGVPSLIIFTYRMLLSHSNTSFPPSRFSPGPPYTHTHGERKREKECVQQRKRERGGNACESPFRTAVKPAVTWECQLCLKETPQTKSSWEGGLNPSTSWTDKKATCS